MCSGSLASHEGGEGRAVDGESDRADTVVGLVDGAHEILHSRRLHAAGSRGRNRAATLVVVAKLAADERMPRPALHRAPAAVVEADRAAPTDEGALGHLGSIAVGKSISECEREGDGNRNCNPDIWEGSSVKLLGCRSKSTHKY
mgnify:CR=1 FL=1